MVVLSRLFDWRAALVVVKPDTLIRWHRKGFRLFWRWKSRPVGRPQLPKDLQELIRKIATQNPTWGEERIANELRPRLAIRASPRTVQNDTAGGGRPGHKPDPSQRWLTFVRNHAQAIVACDFLVVVTAIPSALCICATELGTRGVLHQNVTATPTADWTLQQFREALPGNHPYRFVIHDRDSIFSRELDKAVTAMGVRVLRTPVRSPLANAICERLVGTLRRECLDLIIPVGERHLRQALRSWVTQYNHARVHMSLAPGIPAPLVPSPPENLHRHCLPADQVVRSKAILGGLHHEY